MEIKIMNQTKNFGINLTLLYVQNFFRNLTIFGAVAVPFYLHRAGLDFTRMFILESIFSVGLILFEVPTGFIADRFGRKLSVILGGVFFGGSFLVFGVFTNFWMLAVAELICALGMALTSGADKALLYDLLKASASEDKALKVMARYDIFSTAGLLVGLPAGSMLVASGWIDYKTALLIGLIQCLAMVPGTSRSAATIIGGMLLGLSRGIAAEFSFFLAIPTMIAASGYMILKTGLHLSVHEWLVLSVGFVVSFFVAWAVVAAFMDFIRRRDFKPFGIYRIVLAAIVVIYFGMNGILFK